MSNRNALSEGEAFLGRYNATQIKGDRKHQEGGDNGNFVATRTGDLVPTRYLTQHAKQRMAQRGVSQRDAIRGTKKSGAIIAPTSGAVVTVIPEAWAAADKDRKKKKKADMRDDKEGKKVSRPPAPSADALPDGYARADITLAQKNTMGLVLGKKHSNIQRLIAKHPSPEHIRYQVDGDRNILLWGPEISVDRLVGEIGVLEKAATETANAMFGPPVPDEMPEGNAHRRIVVPDVGIGHVKGKKGRNISKLRTDHTAALINFDGKTGVMHVWGRPDEVDDICGAVAKITEGAKNAKKRDIAKRVKAAKASNDRRAKDFEADNNVFRKPDYDSSCEKSANKKEKGSSSPNIQKEKGGSSNSSKPSKKKQKEIAKQARTIEITKDDIRAARKERKKKKQQEIKAARR